MVLQESLVWKKEVQRCYKYPLTFECHFSFQDVCFLLAEVKQLRTTLWQGVACDAEKQQCNQCLRVMMIEQKVKALFTIHGF